MNEEKGKEFIEKGKVDEKDTVAHRVVIGLKNISDMTDDELNRALAIEVLKKDPFLDGANQLSIDIDHPTHNPNAPEAEIISSDYRGWNPAWDLDQAMECAKKLYPILHYLHIEMGIDKYNQQFAEIVTQDWRDFLGRSHGRDRYARCLSEAVLMAFRKEAEK